MRKGMKLYDHQNDPYEMKNLWSDPEYLPVRVELMERLFTRVNEYARNSTFDDDDARKVADYRLHANVILQKRLGKWSDITKAARLDG